MVQKAYGAAKNMAQGPAQLRVVGGIALGPEAFKVYDLRHFCAGAKPAQNRRAVCCWV